MFAMFALAFAGHLFGSVAAFNEEQLGQGLPAVSALQHLASPRLWFESFQNWQSEFVSLLAIVLLSVWLRQKDSPASKPVEAPHDHTPG